MRYRLDMAPDKTEKESDGLENNAEGQGLWTLLRDLAWAFWSQFFRDSHAGMRAGPDCMARDVVEDRRERSAMALFGDTTREVR